MKNLPTAHSFRLSRKNLRFTTAILLASLAGGCTQKEYIYVTESGHFVFNQGEIAVRFPDLTSPVDDSNTAAGTWSAPLSAITPADHINLAVINGQNNRVQLTRIGHAENLPATTEGGPVNFRIHSAAASLQFEGILKDHQASGTVQLILDPTYRQAMEKMTGERIIVEQAISLAHQSIPLDVVQAFYDAGYRFHLGDYQRLILSGVDASYAKALRQGGYTLSADELIRLYRAGVSADYAIAMQALGLGQMDELIRLYRSGVEPKYASAMHTFPFGQKADELIRARRSGLEVAYLQGLAESGYTFTLDDMIRLVRSGVEADYAAALWKAGYRFDADALIRLRRSGVSADYAVLLAGSGRSLLSADEIIQLQRRGIDARTIEKLRN